MITIEGSEEEMGRAMMLLGDVGKGHKLRDSLRLELNELLGLSPSHVISAAAAKEWKSFLKIVGKKKLPITLSDGNALQLEASLRAALEQMAQITQQPVEILINVAAQRLLDDWQDVPASA